MTSAPVPAFDLPAGRLAARRAHLLAELRRSERRRVPVRWHHVAVAAALVAAAGVAANAALGLEIGGRIHDFVAGTSAPPPIEERLRDDATAERIPLFVGAPVEVAGAAKGVLAIDTTGGPVALWTLPTKSDEGRPPTCYFLEFVRLSERAGEPRGDSRCIARPAPSAGLAWARTKEDVDGRVVALVSGLVADNVASAWLRAVDGTTTPVELEGRFFLAELPRPDDDYELIARNAAGADTATQRITWFSANMQDFLNLRATGPPRTLIETRDSLGRPLALTIRPAQNGLACVATKGTGGAGGTCGSGTQLRADHGIRVGPSMSAQTFTLHGSVGHEIETLELRYQDGHVDDIPIVEQFILFGVPRARFEDGLRPVELVGRDRAGRIVAERVLSADLFRPESPIWLDRGVSP